LSEVPPAPPGGVTPLQRQALELYVRYRERNPTARELVRPKTLLARLRMGLLGFIAILLALAGFYAGAAFVGGVWFGLLLSLGAYTGRFLQVWPALRSCLDWSRVEARLAEPTVAPQRTARSGRVLVVLALITGLVLAWPLVERTFDPVAGNPPQGVILLSTEWCGYCKPLREHLAANHVPYTEIDTEKTWRGALAFLAVGARGVPVTIVGAHVINGLNLPMIDQSLRDAGYTVDAPLEFPRPAPLSNSPG
jgi:glutaredoxin